MPNYMATDFSSLTGKGLAKATKKAAKQASQNMKASQKGEIFALKQYGADRPTVKAERQANRDELIGMRDALRQLTPQTAAAFQMPTLQSAAARYSGDLAARVSDLANRAAAAQQQYNITPIYRPDDRTARGIGVNALMKNIIKKDTAGAYNQGNPVGSLLARAESQWGKSLTAADIARNGVLKSIKPVKGQEGMFRVGQNFGTGDRTNKAFSFYQQNQDGTYTPTGYDKYFHNPDSSGGGLLGTIAKLPIGSIIAAMSGVPAPVPA